MNCETCGKPKKRKGLVFQPCKSCCRKAYKKRKRIEAEEWAADQKFLRRIKEQVGCGLMMQMDFSFMQRENKSYRNWFDDNETA